MDGEGQPIPDAIIEIWQATLTENTPAQAAMVQPALAASDAFQPTRTGASSSPPQSQDLCGGREEETVAAS